MHPVETQDAPAPAGHYSQGIVHDGKVYVSGQLGIDRSAPGTVPEGIEAQTRHALDNVRGILEAAGSRLDLVLQMTIYVAGIEHWPDVNRVYAEVMGAHRPARAVVPVPELHYGYLVEIQAIAALAEEGP